MMNRRGFLSGLLAAAAGATLDPEQALWKPGKLISVPPRVHVPRIHTLHVLVAHEPIQWEVHVDRMPINYQNTWLNATADLDAAVERLEAEAGGVRARYLH